MYANIRKTNHLVQTLRYHERKIERGQAECLAAENFVKDLDQLTLKDKLFHFNRLTSLNERIKKHVFHIALLFYPEEILSNDKMLKMGKEYMEKMGLGRQPYLMYRHYDSNHPHIHLLTVAVKQHGKGIFLTPADFSLSSEITHKLEVEYNLLKTGHKLKKWIKQMRTEHKRDIVHQIKQLPKKELVHEDVLKPEMPRQSKPIRNFQSDPKSQRVITAIEWVLAGKSHDFNTLREDLAQERVSMEIRKDGVFYKDQLTKTTFEGQALGHRYTLEGLRQRGVKDQAQTLDQTLEQKQTHRIRPTF
ncbi:relaxase/mobilization nuclease domain-containing protein [Flavitalea flava]